MLKQTITRKQDKQKNSIVEKERIEKDGFKTNTSKKSSSSLIFNRSPQSNLFTNQYKSD